MGIIKKYPMIGKTKEVWGNELLSSLNRNIEDISEIIELDDFWNKINNFYNDLNEEDALNWIAETFGYKSAGAMIDAQLDDYAFENSGVYDDD